MTLLPILLIAVGSAFVGCKSEVDMKTQQKAFHLDADGNLLNKKDEIVKKAGEFKMEEGYYVDINGERIKRDIDKTKEKINEAVDNTKEKLNNAVENTKEGLSEAASNTVDGVKDNFNKLFNTKAVGTAYELSEITFDPESHRITNMSKAEVEGLAAALKEHPESRIQVQVHTADGETKAACKEMASLRADLVKNMLVTLGVNEDQISAKGLGLTTKDAEKAVANKVEVIVEE